MRHCCIATTVRLACVKPAASVRSEPGSNSQVGGQGSGYIRDLDPVLLWPPDGLAASGQQHRAALNLLDQRPHAARRPHQHAAIASRGQSQRAGIQKPQTPGLWKPLHPDLWHGGQGGQCLGVRT